MTETLHLTFAVNGIVQNAGVTTQTHPPPPRPSGYVPSHHPTGYRVTSDLNLAVMEDDSEIALTCNAISHGHLGDTHMKKTEKLLSVLSKRQIQLFNELVVFKSSWASPYMVAVSGFNLA